MSQTPVADTLLSCALTLRDVEATLLGLSNKANEVSLEVEDLKAIRKTLIEQDISYIVEEISMWINNLDYITTRGTQGGGA